MIEKMRDAKELIVVKFGSSSLTGSPANLAELEKNLLNFSRDLAKYSGSLVIVSSGAVFCGQLLKPEVDNSAVLATIGNPMLFGMWQRSLLDCEVTSSQVMITHRELDIKEERVRLVQVLQDSLAAGVIPIINENDALSDQELKQLTYGGDNDGLAAEVAKLLGASHLIIFTDQEGFLVDGALQNKLSLSQLGDMFSHAQASERGGGMVTKLKAVEAFLQSRVRSPDFTSAHIAKAGQSVGAVLEGSTGTTITAQVK